MAVAVLVAVLSCFANRHAGLFVVGRFEAEADRLTLVVPGGIGADLRMHGKNAGSPLEEGSGHVRVRAALATLARNKWIEVERTVAETRIRLGSNARELTASQTDVADMSRSP